MSENTNDTTNAVDAAIKAAQARKAKKAAVDGTLTQDAPATKGKAKASNKAPAAPKTAKPKLTDAEREARKAKLDAERAERKATKAAAREAKRAEKLAARKPAHMSKVLKAAEKLPSLNDTAARFLDEACSNFGRATIAALALHLQHFNRVKATERALTSKVEAGSTVTIVGGDPRFIGKTGTVTKAQRIRCYVEVDGLTKPVYCFTSDVEVVSAPAASTGTEG